MSDTVIENAQEAANNPANGSPDERAAIEQQQQQTDTRSYKQKWDDERAAEKATADQTAQAKMSPAEKRLADLRSRPEFFNAKDAKHPATMVEYRAAMFEAQTAEEKAKLVEAPAAEIRCTFGVMDPAEYLTPGMADRWIGDEQHAEAILFMAREGVAPAVMAEMSEYAISKLAAYNGEPLPQVEIEQFVKRYTGKVPPAVLEKLVKWYSSEVVGS